MLQALGTEQGIKQIKSPAFLGLSVRWEESNKNQRRESSSSQACVKCVEKSKAGKGEGWPGR